MIHLVMPSEMNDMEKKMLPVRLVCDLGVSVRSHGRDCEELL